MARGNKASPVRSTYSMDNQDSDADSAERDHSPVPAGKPGRKKNPNSQAARRDQNRIAQREFRLRKQQRIRDLEARVELLSGNQDETFMSMRYILKDLVAENHQLRTVIKGLSQAVGEGLPRFLPQMGWQPHEFDIFLNKTDTDTAMESFATLKRKSQSSGSGLKRVSDEDSGNPNPKKKAKVAYGASATRSSLSSSASPNQDANGTYARGSNGDLYASQQQDVLSFSALFDIPFTAATNPMLAPPAPRADSPSAYLPSASGSQRAVYSGGLPSMELRPRSHLNGMNATLESSSLGLTTAPLPIVQEAQAQSISAGGLEEDPRKQDAFKLIHYHLDNYRRNPSYHLPTSLRPTLVQRTIPHDTVIDAIPLPELRDRMILLKGRFELADACFSFGTSSRVHDDDALSQANWELQEGWLRQFWFLVDQSLLNATNHWRTKRGEPELTLADLGASDAIPTFGDTGPR